jgi:hypothetical protein
MGFLSKLKKKVGTGGVKVQLVDVPAAITVDAGSVDVGVTITATDEAQSFTNVYVALDLVRTTHQNNSFDNDFNNGPNQANQQQTNRFVLARIDLGPTDIAAGETRSYTVTLPTDALAGGNRAVELGDSPLANAAEGLLKMGMSGQVQDRYELHAVAELDGMRDPKDTQQVNVVGAANQSHFGFELRP